jgi:hypothetical protein
VVGEFDANEQFRRRDRGDGDVVTVADEPAESPTGPLGSDQNCGVEDQTGHCRSCTSTACLVAASSSSHELSTRCRRSNAFTVAPDAPAVGSIRAITRPARVTTNVSPSFSTQVRRAENRRAASVAEIVFTMWDCLIMRLRSSADADYTRVRSVERDRLDAVPLRDPRGNFEDGGVEMCGVGTSRAVPCSDATAGPG